LLLPLQAAFPFQFAPSPFGASAFSPVCFALFVDGQSLLNGLFDGRASLSW